VASDMHLAIIGTGLKRLALTGVVVVFLAGCGNAYTTDGSTFGSANFSDTGSGDSVTTGGGSSAGTGNGSDASGGVTSPGGDTSGAAPGGTSGDTTGGGTTSGGDTSGDTSGNTSGDTTGGGTSTNTNSQLYLAWKSNPDPSVTGYRVLFGPTVGTATTVISDLPTGTPGFDPQAPSKSYGTWTDLGLHAGDTACFRIQAYNQDGLSDPTPGVCTQV
jgi:hypothetical protein